MKIGIIGLGLVGAIHLRAYRNLPELEIVAIAEPDPVRLGTADAPAGTARYADYRQLLANERIDIACVCTPASTHAEIVIACASRGTHVLCEKPIAVSLADADEMIAACKAAGVQLAYGASYRFLPALVRAREIILAGEIGDILLMREELVGGAGPDSHEPLGFIHYPEGGPGGSGLGLVDHGIHLIDAFRWLAASQAVRVFGRGNISGDTPGTEFLHVEFASGAVGQLLYNDTTHGTELPTDGIFTEGEGWDLSGPVAAGHWLARPGMIHVHGTKGALRIFHYANHLFQMNGDKILRHRIDEPPAPGHFEVQMKSFIERLRSSEPPAVTAEEGREALRILLEAYAEPMA
jgi:UDP-N-acetyl-2-amino-2-deoxyglucuronate dehydrogenase